MPGTVHFHFQLDLGAQPWPIWVASTFRRDTEISGRALQRDRRTAMMVRRSEVTV